MKVNDYFIAQIRIQIAPFYVIGGYEVLKKEYPERLAEIEEALDQDFTEQGINSYILSMQKGLKKVKHWEGQE